MMQAPMSKSRFTLIASIAALGVVAQLAQGEQERSLQVNLAALQFAQELIKQCHFVDDRKGAWAAHKPSRATENECIRAYGFAEYAKWHLAIDNRHREKTKAHYKFPFGDFRNVHRCGLLAVKARAHEYGYAEIERAATELLAMIESARPARQKDVD
jgi:hypothetical protein